MISLKEEIEFIVDAYASESKPYQRKAIVDNVLEKIEKRIDSMIKDLPEYKIFDMELLLKVKELFK